MAPHADTIDQNTKIPIGVIWAIGVVLFGAVTWLTTMFVNLTNAQADIKQLREDRTILERDINEIKSDVRLIGDRLGVKRERQ